MFALKDNCATTKKIYNVGIYVRLSREDEKTQQSESILNQKDYLTRYVLEQSWNLVDIYADDGFTGTNFDRPDFKRLLKDIETKKINLVITKDLSRLGRDYIDTGYYLERYFPEKSIRYIALNDGIDTFENNSNNDMSPFKAVMNDMYAKDISKKVRTAMNTKRRNGEFIGGFAPYGYLKDPQNKNKLVIDPEVAHIVKTIFDMYIAGSGYAHISHVLNGEQLPAPSTYMAKRGFKGRNSKLALWTQETIKHMLMNPTYAGNITQNKAVKVNYKSKKLKTLPKDMWITVEDTHEPIVDKETFNLVQQIAANKIHYDYSLPTNAHLLAGLIFCRDCGERMTFTKTQKGEFYCICSKYKRFKLCTRHSYHEKELEDYILREFRKISRVVISTDELFKAAQKGLPKSKDENINEEINKIDIRLSEIKRTIKSLYEDKLKGILTEQDFIDLSRDYHQEREQLASKLLAMQQRKTDLNPREDNQAGLLKQVKDFADFKDVSKVILSTLIEKIEIAENRELEIHYNFRNPL